MTHSLTAEQSAILVRASSSSTGFIIEARAGTGKTHILGELLCGSATTAPPLIGSCILMAFNRSIADECKTRFSPRLSFERSLEVSISTVHSHGLAAFRRAGHRTKTLSGKVNFILKDLLAADAAKDDDIWRNMGKVSRLVGYAKSAGFGLSSLHEPFPAIGNISAWHSLAEHFDLDNDLIGDTTIEEVIDYARRVLQLSNARLNSIDFDDMIYLPLLHNLPLPTYNNVLIDEAQDINATRRELAFRSVAPGGRIIAVGDPHQAIYGFTGADAESLSNIGKRISPTCDILPLSICWRCDGAIIREAQQIVPDIYTRPGAEDKGQVVSVPFIAGTPKTGDAPQLDLFSAALPGDAVLCRLNKPNVATCLGFLRRGKRAKIEGRDLGKKLEQHVQSSCETYSFQLLRDTLLDLERYEENEVGRLVAKNKSEAAIAMLEDEIDAARLVMERCIETNSNAGWADFTTLLASLFGDDVSAADTITLCSVHKAKGREWKRVFVLGRKDYMPFHLAKQDWEVEQEYNLIYVALTRAEQTLFYVTGVQSAIDRGEHREVRAASATGEA